MPGRTTILLTGRGLGLIEQALAIARDLEPATVVFEDVDLVAAERTFEFGGGGPLFELLNQMEGLAEDADLLFLLTSNRPDVLEPALAARPGRVDLALEIPLPDAAARARLLGLYAAGIEYDEAEAVERTEGVERRVREGADASGRAARGARRARGRSRGRLGHARRSAGRPLRARPAACSASRARDDDEFEPPDEMLRAVEAAGLLMRPKSP